MTVIICITFVILFIIWQYKVITKYAFKFDKLKIDTVNKFLAINGVKIKFIDIDFITVEELEQPSMLERTLTKSAYNYMADMILHLKNGTTKKCTFNFKGGLYKSLKQLQQYIKINTDIECYNVLPSWLFALIFIIGSILMFLILYYGVRF